ncbi:hypothetical protein [Clostridium beijerinckii]|uniref:Uncharacterized protein n=1 Tax=Clostridium beijerinckii TaxID=1520 RepID=A0AAW3W6E4_CLOBE|nr:hypothetical protein [Clostridium beijerinckii]MBC2457140.1 hypothetical protein [Clostridium beijerinckii]MBC2474197.1 hypothetical protein [Clostridium beijerinckii]NOV58704.1 hypothetical protein [Clostridium beijerinckii]NOV71911.1 hypothetical protein [Clostridium beijerinckii]NOW32059.1 hypothetical protein [Clostridium beijerinckii]
MYEQYPYCAKCSKYYNSRHKCDSNPIYILKPTKHIVDRLYSLGFDVAQTTHGLSKTPPTNEAHFARIEIIFGFVYSELLLQELPEGWCWEDNTLQSMLVYTAEIEYNTPHFNLKEKKCNQGIKLLEAYLDAINDEGLKAAMLLLNN